MLKGEKLLKEQTKKPKDYSPRSLKEQREMIKQMKEGSNGAGRAEEKTSSN